MRDAAHHATNDGVRLAYETRAARSRNEELPVLLVQGLACDRRAWGPAADALNRDFDLVLLDNRGVGLSDAPRGPYTVAELARDAVAVLDDAGIERAHVVGASLGGMVAQQLALAHPQRVGRLVLACTTTGPGCRLPLRTLWVLAQMLAGVVPREAAIRHSLELSLGAAAAAERPELLEELVEQQLELMPSRAAWHAQACAASSFSSRLRLAEIAAPTLVLHGTADAVVDVREGERLAAGIRNARLELFEGSGHLFFREHPERFASQIAAFLTEAPPQQLAA
jgi:3-oxoadipate enol-lactonase